MFSTSRDILNLVLSVCVVAFTFFLCWFLYYFIASVRNIHRLIARIETGVTKVEEVVALVKEKLKNSSAYLMILGEIAKKAMEFIQTRRGERREKKETGKKK